MSAGERLLSPQESLAEDVRRAIQEGTRGLKQQIAALNLLRTALGLKPVRLVEDDRRHVA